MKKNKQELVNELLEKYKEAEIDKDTLKKSIQEDIKKALKAGHDLEEPEPTNSELKAAEHDEAKDTEVKFEQGLFKEKRLGSTLEQGPMGNYVTNTKKPAFDYEKAYKNSYRNKNYSSEDLEKFTNEYKVAQKEAVIKFDNKK